MRQAACGSHHDPDLWFADLGDQERQQEALRICASCPVRAACLAFSLSMPPQPGIWGGTTEDQRIQVLPLDAERAERRKARQAENAGQPPVSRRRRGTARGRRLRLSASPLPSPGHAAAHQAEALCSKPEAGL
jgi:WhiB family redox-sensing transcriptional regulator